MSTDWLLDNGNPVVRYKTHTEILNTCNDSLLQKIMDEVLELPQTQKRLLLLKNLDFSKTHGSPSMYLENTLPMLNDYGIYYGSTAFVEQINNIDKVFTIILDSEYDKHIAYPFLLRSKFPNAELHEFANKRISEMYDFTEQKNYNIYDDVANYKNIPVNFRDRPIVKPGLALPLIYDIVMMAAVYKQSPAIINTKIDNIIEYVISPEYDVVVPMYGIRFASPNKYYAMGWDCKKPFNDKQDFSNPNLHRLLLYSSFPNVVKTAWFQNAIDYLTQFKTSSGTYIFPKEYLVEADGNWVLGVRMSLAENRRKKQWAEIESTFYMNKLFSNMNC